MPDPNEPMIARPAGHPLLWGRSDVDRLSKVGRPDFQAADALWQAHAPAVFERLLGPVPGTRGGPARFYFRFDPGEQVYITPSGRRVNPAFARGALLSFVASAQADFERRAADVAAGRVPLAEWQGRMAADLRSLYLCAAAFGAGGYARVTPQDLDDVRGDMPDWVDDGAELALGGTGGGGLRAAIARLGRFARQMAGRPRSSRWPTRRPSPLCRPP